MIRPLLRIVGGFIFIMGFLMAASGGYVIFTGGMISEALIRIAVGTLVLLAGHKARESGGTLDMVSVDPDDLAHFFEIAKAYGLGANAHPAATFAVGCAAAALITLSLGALGFISSRALLLAAVILGVYGGLLGLVKRRSLGKGTFVKRDGKRYGSYRQVSVYFVPVLVVGWLLLSAEAGDPLLIVLIAAGTLFWVGRAFHMIWDALHIAGLVLIYGEDSPATIEWGLMQWLRHTRIDADPDRVEYDAARKKVGLTGRFDRKETLERDLLKFDFVDEVEFKAS